MKILVDMNLSPGWCPILSAAGWATVHWSAIGPPGATDREIMNWARTEGFVVITNDLDFGAILAATRRETPSVVQIRTQDLLPSPLAARLIRILRQFQPILEQGALVTIDEAKERVRVLPLIP